MSSMLEQAIIDAEQLKETAQRTAEEAVIEKYQSEIKEAVGKILEQEEDLEEESALEVDSEGDISLIQDLPSAQLAEEDEVVEINLDKLEEMMAEEMAQGELDPSDMLEREEVAEELATITEDDDLDEEVELDEDINELLEEEEDLDEEIEINEEDIAAVIAELLSEKELGPDLEKDEETLEEVEDLEEKKAKPDFLDLDKDGDKEESMKQAAKQAKEKKKKVDESRLLQKENKSLLREQTKMNNKVQLLEKKLNKYGTVVEQLKQKLDESNLSNAKLLYQNRILNSISAFIPRKEVKPKTDAFSDRMKRLAGLK